MEIGLLGDQVGLGQGQPAADLLKIGRAHNAGVHTIDNLLEHFLVTLQVFLGEVS